jgi:5-methylcytosine-specific restriction endonuclease McrA
MTTAAPALAPRCTSCGKRHSPAVPCWRGRYVHRVMLAVLAEHGDRCVHCGRPGSTSVEHVIPRSYGGLDTLDNCRPAHLLHNLERGTKPMPGFALPTSSRVW